MNTIEGNKLIAEFMGAKHDGRKYMIFPDGRHIVHGDEYDSDLEYHSSWDWLMPPIKKFMGIKNLAYKQLGKYNYWCIKIDDAVCSYDLQFTHATLINAIEWYNSEQSVKESDTTNDK